MDLITIDFQGSDDGASKLPAPLSDPENPIMVKDVFHENNKVKTWLEQTLAQHWPRRASQQLTRSSAAAPPGSKPSLRCDCAVRLRDRRKDDENVSRT
ncbi:hypothetical protein EVAR_68329_1 [Eumeta japonica]|uniref:Uncharacterized protein n=1 Tax=Eumeta variegata TaxID=151549 RepID=A0A4C1SAS7_EUMVA|nr:hypothetical protein EVAR_68329_1 [Eumeta japonica]